MKKEFYNFSADILKSLSENKIGMKYCLDFFSIHWKTIIKIYDIKELSVIFKNISNENEYKVVSTNYIIIILCIYYMYFSHS